ncbi:hypothetical protein NDU88_001374 [Pleurodeles waltl]|uniref:Uncharacterized protein n=1 Tax=Pleurodeles waltl TaxID=8319 RepID=A0AAV7U675_PLEWA|nr:hypothetical protein NDU88_001374 [Pleurodeles waltl]
MAPGAGDRPLGRGVAAGLPTPEKRLKNTEERDAPESGGAPRPEPRWAAAGEDAADADAGAPRTEQTQVESSPLLAPTVPGRRCFWISRIA